MPSLADLLHRFRRLGSPPGAPAAGLGVPEQPGATITGELVQVFSAVDELQSDADRIVQEAESQATAERDLARREAARIREDAEREASEGARLDAGARARHARRGSADGARRRRPGCWHDLR